LTALKLTLLMVLKVEQIDFLNKVDVKNYV